MLVFVVFAGYRFHFLFGEVAHTLAEGFLFFGEVEIHNFVFVCFQLSTFSFQLGGTKADS